MYFIFPFFRKTWCHHAKAKPTGDKLVVNMKIDKVITVLFLSYFVSIK